MTTSRKEMTLAAGVLALVIVGARLAPAATTVVPAPGSGRALLRGSGGCPPGLGAAPCDDGSDSGDDGGDDGGGDDGSTED